MEFGLLGPLAVRRDGVAITVPAGKQRVLLAALLLKANHPVPLDELTEALWGAEPVASARPTLQSYVMRLRLQALELRIDADLRLGGCGEVIGELRQLTAADPLRERLHGLLMLALYRDGRQGEALAAYARARRMLIDELGAEPGTGLRQLHQQILAADPALDL